MTDPLTTEKRLPAYNGRLDAKGRCCGRKPIQYKRPEPRQYCCRCDRQFDMAGRQVENWAFSKCKGCGFWIKGGESLCGECACEQESA